MNDAHSGFDVIVREPFEFHRNIVGTLYVIVDGETFPSDDWSDFAVIVMSWWLKEAIRLRSSATADGELLFMDGPYFIAVEKQQRSWRLTFCQRTAASDVVLIGPKVVEEAEVFASLLRAGDEVAEMCRDWRTDDLADLESALSLLR